MIKKTKSGYKLVSKTTGRTLGTHKTRVDARRQERAIKASQAKAGRKK